MTEDQDYQDSKEASATMAELCILGMVVCVVVTFLMLAWRAMP